MKLPLEIRLGTLVNTHYGAAFPLVEAKGHTIAFLFGDPMEAQFIRDAIERAIRARDTPPVEGSAQAIIEQVQREMEPGSNLTWTATRALADRLAVALDLMTKEPPPTPLHIDLIERACAVFDAAAHPFTSDNLNLLVELRAAAAGQPFDPVREAAEKARDILETAYSTSIRRHPASAFARAHAVLVEALGPSRAEQRKALLDAVDAAEKEQGDADIAQARALDDAHEAKEAYDASVAKLRAARDKLKLFDKIKA